MHFQASIARDALERGMLVVCLVDEVGLMATLHLMRGDYGKHWVFPVLKVKGYVQDPSEPSGGTGLFVVVACRRWQENLELFRNCDANNYLDKVGFCSSANAFHATNDNLIHEWRAEWVDGGLVSREEILPQQFFSSLALFFVTKSNSLCYVFPNTKDASMLFCGRSFMETRRKVILARYESNDEECQSLCSVIAGRAVTVAEPLPLPRNVAGLVQWLPPSSQYKSKLAKLVFLDKLIENPNFTYAKTDDMIAETEVPPERVEQALVEAEKYSSFRRAWGEDQKGSKNWKSSLRSAGFAKFETAESAEEFDAAQKLLQIKAAAERARREEAVRLTLDRTPKKNKGTKRKRSESAEGQPKKKKARSNKNAPIIVEEEVEDREVMDETIPYVRSLLYRIHVYFYFFPS